MIPFLHLVFIKLNIIIMSKIVQYCKYPTTIRFQRNL